MGLAPMKAEADYWRKGNDIWGNKFIQKTMSHKQYHKMKKSFSVDIKKLTEYLNKQFQCYWEPFTNAAIY
jgi:hypothetical protein